MGNHTDPRVTEPMLAIVCHLIRSGRSVLIADYVELPDIPDEVIRVAEGVLPERAELIVTVGGDGTMLYAGRLAAPHGVPLLGINRGRLGFLTDVSPGKMLSSIDEVLGGQFSRDTRSLLQAEIVRDGEVVALGIALNDVVLQKWETGHMLDFETRVDGCFVNLHGGDGLIVATATGSTAYALSCGGPIIQPRLEAVVLVPICPHTLSDRPLVLPADCHVEAFTTERLDTKAQVTCDGHLIGELAPGERLSVAPAADRITLIHPPGHDYYEILRSKLHWGRNSRIDAGEQ